MNKHMIVIAGPTASGKTKLAISLALHFGCEIINADSRQVYKEMHTGTAKPDKSELEAVRHHMISTVSIHTEFSAGQFMDQALDIAKNLFRSNNLVVVAGGSGLYIDALCNGLDRFPEVDKSLRKKLNNVYAENGISYLQEELKNLDPDYYEVVDLNNHRRLIRALEVSISSGKPYSFFRKKEGVKRDFNVIKFGIKTDREELYERINQRVDRMLEEGLLNEARELYPFKDLAALRTVGYRELFDYFDNKTDMETAIQMIKQNSRNYAKRQLTWLRKDTEINWFSRNDAEKIIAFIESKVSSF